MVSWQRSMAVGSLLAFGLGMSACVEGPQGPEGPQGHQGPPGAAADAGTGSSSSGSRLKLRFYSGADGSRSVLKTTAGSQGGAPVIQDVFEDTQFNTRCTALNAADDRMRCLPFAEILVRFNVYADSQCTVPLFIPGGQSTPGQTPRFILQDISSGFELPPKPRFQVSNVGSEHFGSIYQQGTPTPGGIPCNLGTRSQLYRYYVAGTEIPASSFVEFTERFE